MFVRRKEIMQRLNRVLRVQNVMLKCSQQQQQQQLRTNSLSRVLALSSNAALTTNRISSHQLLSTNQYQNDMIRTTQAFAKRFYASGGNLPEHSKILLPALSPTMEQGTLAKWAKKEGDHVVEGDLIAEIETDKATMGLEASEEGYVAKLLVAEKTRDLPLKTLLCIMVKDKNHVAAFADYKPTEAESKPSAPKAEAPKPAPAAAPAPKPAAAAPPPPPPPSSSQAPQTASAPVKRASGERVFATPLARKLAAERNIDLAVSLMTSELFKNSNFSKQGNHSLKTLI